MQLPPLCRVPALALAAALLPAAGSAADPAGQAIYNKQCASCHGKQGEGTKRYEPALTGDRGLAQLADVIQKTMPESDPESLSKEDAAKVAAYVYDAFYSKDAQARNKPPRIELSRLTVRQYRHAVADLVGGFRGGPPKWGDQRGLKGEYFAARGFRNDKKVVDRVDPELKFDWGTDAPADKIEPEQFSIRWSGSVLAPETGEYEFTVRSEHAVRLWVNDQNAPLVDAWVRSGTDMDHKGTVPLVGGRVYPVRVEFSKAKQGVDDKKKIKAPASLALLWKPPHGVSGVVPARHLAPTGSPEGYVVTTAFPPDDRSYGWERGTTVSKAWDQATTDAALDAAGYVAGRVDQLAGVTAADKKRPGGGSGNPAAINLDETKAKPVPDREKKLRQFCKTFAERAFRRPLTPDQQKAYIDRQFEVVKDPDAAVKRVVLLVLKSPRFLYREVDTPPTGGSGGDGYDVAARLAFALWDSLPDQELLTAAAGNKLATREQVARQAERMLADPRAKSKLRGFLLTWLKLDQAPDMAKDAKRFPGFDAAVLADLRASLELFLDEVLWSGDGDFRKLLTADHLYLNGRLAKFYGADLPADAPFQPAKLDADKRAGALTHPYLLAAYSYVAETSPIHRGVFLARGVLGINLRPPMEAFSPLAPDLHPTLTTRERVQLQTSPAACQACHTVINPLGNTLEHFDAVGRFRAKDNNKPVDATGQYQTRGGETVTFAGVKDLASYLAGSDEVHAAFVEQLFHHLVQQPVRAYGVKRPGELQKAFAANGFNVRKLAVEAAVTAALTPRESKPVAADPPQKDTATAGN